MAVHTARCGNKSCTMCLVDNQVPSVFERSTAAQRLGTKRTEIDDRLVSVPLLLRTLYDTASNSI